MKKLFVLIAMTVLTSGVADAAWVWRHCDSCAGVQVVKIRLQGTDCWFMVAGDNLLYGFDASTVSGKNYLTMITNAKATGQPMTFKFDDATLRYGTNVGRNVDGIEVR